MIFWTVSMVFKVVVNVRVCLSLRKTFGTDIYYGGLPWENTVRISQGRRPSECNKWHSLLRVCVHCWRPLVVNNITIMERLYGRRWLQPTCMVGVCRDIKLKFHGTDTDILAESACPATSRSACHEPDTPTILADLSDTRAFPREDVR